MSSCEGRGEGTSGNGAAAPPAPACPGGSDGLPTRRRLTYRRLTVPVRPVRRDRTTASKFTRSAWQAVRCRRGLAAERSPVLLELASLLGNTAGADPVLPGQVSR